MIAAARRPPALEPGRSVLSRSPFAAGLGQARAAHLPYLVLLGGLFFNAILAVVNAHIVGLSSAAVIASEVVLVGTALAVITTRYTSAMTLPTAFVVWLLLFMLLRSTIVEPSSSVKFFRDIVIAPVFVMLGLCADPRNFQRYFLTAHAVIFAVGVLEAFNTPIYSALFHVKDYFIATRGLADENFWNGDSDLFVSATRTGSRFLSAADAIMAGHRVSSVFLEPISLGAYCIVVSGYVFACWNTLSLRARVALLATNFFLIVACDGRLAFVSFFVICAACLAWRWLPRVVPVLYLPVLLLAAFVSTALTDSVGGDDDFAGRVAYTVDLLKAYDVIDFLGVSDAHLAKAVDSGVGYLILSQSLCGLILFWLFTSSATHYRTRSQICYTHAISLHIAFNALVSYGFLSIKTAALMWLIRGLLESSDAAMPVGTQSAPVRGPRASSSPAV